MAVKFSGVPTPYNAPSGGIPAPQVSLCKPSNMSPRAAFVEIDWSKYTSGVVIVDLGTISPGQSVDMIKAVFVDNIGLILPVTVFFPDTQFDMTCQANATECQNVLTGNLQAWVILGSTSLSLSSLTAATTRLWFINAPANSFINQVTPQTVQQFELSNYAGTPQAFGPRPMGDIRAFLQYDLAAGTWYDVVNGANVSSTNVLSNYPNVIARSGSYYVVTDIKAYVNGAYQHKTNPDTNTNIIVGFSPYPNIGAQNSILSWNFNLDMSLTEMYSYKLLQDSHGLYLPINPAVQFVGFASYNGSVTNPNCVVGTFNVDFQFSYISQN